jgi:hypothetical protein
VRCHQIGEVVRQLRFEEIVDAIGKILAQAPYGARVGLDGLGLQPLELEVLEMCLVLSVKVGGGVVRHAGSSSRNIAESNPSASRG